MSVADRDAFFAELGRVAAFIEARLAGQVASFEASGGEHALARVSRRLGLGAFERAIVVTLAGVELDPAFADLVSRARGDAHNALTFGVAMAVLPASEDGWAALGPDAPLRRLGVVRMPDGDPLTSAPLRLDEAVMFELMGGERVTTVARRVALVGDARADKAGRARADGLELLPFAAAEVPAGAEERAVLAKRLTREALLGDKAVYLDADGADDEATRRAIVLAGMIGAPTYIALRELPLSSALERVEVPRLTRAEQALLWVAHGIAPEHAMTLAADLDLGPGEIREAAKAGAGARSAARAGARRTLDDLAQRVEPLAERDALVVNTHQGKLLDAIERQVRLRAKVYDTWRFAPEGSRGVGVSALFHGPSGTGKTMAAETIAKRLDVDLYRIDLSSVVSKYIGETEKNLRRVFDAADAGGVALLFDEADALFGKRSEIKDSHDRYANIEVGYLLQRMEAYRGLAILTTNLKDSLDPAFHRRLRFIVPFTFPTEKERERIWQRAFPSETLVDDLDPARFARLAVTGGTIRNIALSAAFIAAERGDRITATDIVDAARVEYAKAEMTLTNAELQGLA